MSVRSLRPELLLNFELYSINILVYRDLKAFKEGQKLTPSKMQLNSPLLCKVYLNSCPLPISLSLLYSLFLSRFCFLFLFLFPSLLCLLTSLLCSLPITQGLPLGYYPIILEDLKDFMQANLCLQYPFIHSQN